MTAEPIRAAVEFVSHQLRDLPSASTGDGHAVILFPGLGSTGTGLKPLLNHLRPLGYDALDWGRGHKGPSGNVDRRLENLSDDVLALVGEDRRSFSLVGWSLGGLYAREAAKRLSSRVRQVITMGTLFNGTTRSTNVGWLYELLNGPSRKPDTRLMGRLRTLPQVPSTSIYSRDDGVVAWQSCLHERALRFVEDVEISGSHLGMGWNRDVMVVTAGRLTSRFGARAVRVT